MRLLPFALLAALLAGCSGTQGVLGQGRAFVPGDGQAAVVPAGERAAAPDVTGTTLDGEELALADLRGPVVVNFWASWCGPCAKEAPALQRVADAYRGRVSVVGVNVKDSRANAVAFERDFGVRYPSWEDPAAAIAARFGGIGPGALPSTLVLDAQHRVAARVFGAIDEVRLSTLLDAVLAEGPGS